MTPLEQLSDICRSATQRSNVVRVGGQVTSVSTNQIGVRGLSEIVSLGDVVRIGQSALGEVVRVDSDLTVVCPYNTDMKINIGDLVFLEAANAVRPDIQWLGRVVNALGEPIDGKSAFALGDDAAPKSKPNQKSSLQRARIEEPLKTGIRTIDIFTPICKGQRLGIFAGSGVGKSTLLSMLAKSDAFDAVVVALVGERGREVREFLEDSIGEEGMGKTVAVVATSDESAMLRKRAPELALDVCEALAAQNMNVLLLADSLTRYAHALREVGIAIGEPPVARGYPSSVFGKLPKLLERAGMGAEGQGSITAIVTVLVDGDDHNDPISDAVRGIIDGHLVLDRSIAEEGRYPPINPLSSVSRLSNKAWSADERSLVLQIRKMISQFEETRDLRMLGGWRPGADPQLDKAVETVPIIYDALCQQPDEPPSQNAFDDLVAHLKGQSGAAAPEGNTAHG